MTAAVRILRARTAGLGSDRLRAQFALHRLLADAEAPARLPPGAILIARRARLALPPRGSGRPVPGLDCALDPLVEQAARPARGFVPAGAQAVLFEDEAELLACLASAFANGVLVDQWWWSGLLQGRSDAAAVTTAWLDRPRAVAAALDMLDRRGEAALVVTRLGEPFSLAIAHAIVVAHDLPQLSEAALTAASAIQVDAAPSQSVAQTLSLAPWRELGLNIETSTLPPRLHWPIILAAGLRRAPAMVRSARFVRQVAEWRAYDAVEADIRQPPTPSHPVQISHPRAARAKPEPTGPRAIVDASLDEPGVAAPAPWRRSQTRPGDTSARADHDDSPYTDHQTDAEQASRPEPVVVAPAERATGTFETPLRTRRGGLLFLLNAGLALDLWGDFSAPQHEGLSIDPWTWLIEMGLRLCGETLKDDAIWPVLKDLAFDLADAFAEPAPRPPPRPMDAQARVLKRRLRAALGVADVRGVRALLLQRPADLWVSATRIDAAFDLASHPIEVRASGLDRDPGWIPAAGRDVRFHFR